MLNAVRSFLVAVGWNQLFILAIGLPLLLLLLSWPHPWLFNRAVAPVLGIKTLTYWESFKLLCYIIVFVHSYNSRHNL